jgi:threonine/homoserine efflux transporter RhtA
VIKKVAWSVVLAIVFCGVLVVAVAHARSTVTGTAETGTHQNLGPTHD